MTTVLPPRPRTMQPPPIWQALIGYLGGGPRLSCELWGAYLRLYPTSGQLLRSYLAPASRHA